jgi:hypothetical protein
MTRIPFIRTVGVAAVALTALVLAGAAGAFGVVLEPLPIGTSGQPYEYQFKVHGGNPPYTFSVEPDVLPPGLSLSIGGRLAGVPQVSGSWTFYVEGSYTYHSDPPRYSQRRFTLDVIAGLSIKTRSLPVATRSSSYKARLTAAGGGTQIWSIVEGRLAPGLSLAQGGLITGSPTSAGAFTFTASVTDAARMTEKTFTLRVVAAPTLAVPSPPAAAVGSPFTTAVRVVGGLAPYAWALRSGVLPRGLTLSKGTVSGTPTVAGRYSVDVVVRDAVGNTATTRLPLVVMPRLRLPAQALAPGIVGRSYAGRIQARGGVAPLRFRLVEGELPAGIALDQETGALAGKPRGRGRHVFAIGVVDRLGGAHQRVFSLRIR